MSVEKERKAFESQNFIKRLLGYSKYDEDRNEYVYFRFEDYAIRDTCELNTAWKAWQASANREGYKLVPVEPTQGMIDKAVCDTPETPSQDYWHGSQSISDDQAIACYKAMIGAIE